MRAPYGLRRDRKLHGLQDQPRRLFLPLFTAGIEVGGRRQLPQRDASGALLFVEGQTPRGVYVLCSGKVKLSTTSKEGKVLILKQAEAGEVLGLSAAISGTNYEMTAETVHAMPVEFYRPPGPDDAAAEARVKWGCMLRSR